MTIYGWFEGRLTFFLICCAITSGKTLLISIGNHYKSSEHLMMHGGTLKYIQYVIWVHLDHFGSFGSTAGDWSEK